ncbi:acyl carrier protein [Streptomyces sp. ISL-100]|uniref:acyl carrier protein n=1 Tax=Streptomyces sp. ISL-100 TaxID=2819173 RepID=UPI001BE8FEF2|nr:acyl carrier protein [Streptomyces sp. ISL-100]MBT2398894.1 acyl carrier protein [Streptomyces sp. ISL-100]
MSDSAVENTGQNLSREELTAWLKERVAEHVEMSADDIRSDELLAGYGLDSVYAFAVIADIEDRLGITLESTVMWDNPTLDALVVAISAEMRTRS